MSTNCGLGFNLVHLTVTLVSLSSTDEWKHTWFSETKSFPWYSTSFCKAQVKATMERDTHTHRRTHTHTYNLKVVGMTIQNLQCHLDNSGMPAEPFTKVFQLLIHCGLFAKQSTRQHLIRQQRPAKTLGANGKKDTVWCDFHNQYKRISNRLSTSAQLTMCQFLPLWNLLKQFVEGFIVLQEALWGGKNACDK